MAAPLKPRTDRRGGAGAFCSPASLQLHLEAEQYHMEVSRKNFSNFPFACDTLE
jgi:hypothetical protein